MSELEAEIQRLAAPNLRKRLYVAFSYPVASVEETMPHIPTSARAIDATYYF
ncbi:hypothetical protein AB3X82_12385 [Paraburkholderia phenoliruptrix]|uniref:Uncharacterized protein n=1 Tax=Paraburkholderia phenoliruptrix TaxID=252970 RepID=A0ABV3WAU4_9BURK